MQKRVREYSVAWFVLDVGKVGAMAAGFAAGVMAMRLMKSICESGTLMK